MSIHKTADSLLLQLGEVVNQLTDDQYSSSLSVLSGSSIGQHIRHTLEFFICLIDGRNHGVINYDIRNRDELIETDRKTAATVIKTISDFLRREENDFPIDFCADYTLSGTEEITVKSSFYRELAYNVEHAIHHMALIKIGVLTSSPEVTLPKHFGVASSTVRYQVQKKE
jgi:uncharacterized damage-inducible protein DinB